MKRAIFVGLAVCAVLMLMVGIAFAQGSDVSSYVGTAELGHTWTDGLGAAGNGFYMDSEGNPHGGFTTTSHNCQVCHSVHHADTEGQALLPDTVANACTYCHITSATGYIQIYDHSAANYTDASDFGHNATGGAECTTCHQVHAASNQMVSAALYGDQPYLVEKILKVTAAEPLLDATGTALVFTGAETSETAVSMWCTRCHKESTGTYGYYNTDQNGMSHVMRDPSGAYVNGSGTLIGEIASSTSIYCSSCHNRGEVNTTQPMVAVDSTYNFPHFSDGVRFLTTASSLDASGVPDASGAAADSHADGVCLNCHRGMSVEASGVGIGF